MPFHNLLEPSHCHFGQWFAITKRLAFPRFTDPIQLTPLRLQILSMLPPPFRVHLQSLLPLFRGQIMIKRIASPCCKQVPLRIANRVGHSLFGPMKVLRSLCPSRVSLPFILFEVDRLIMDLLAVQSQTVSAIPGHSIRFRTGSQFEFVHFHRSKADMVPIMMLRGVTGC